MIRGCREYGVREPEFIDRGDAFRVIFYRSNIETGTEKIEDQLFYTLSVTEKKVVKIILKNPEFTQDKMAEIMGMSKSGIRYVMDKYLYCPHVFTIRWQ